MTSTGLTPNLFIPGMPKCGTSSLHIYLDRHPDIQMSSKKEPHVFTFPQRFRDYQSIFGQIFKSDQRAPYLGESSTSYLLSEAALARIKEASSNARFIVILRNPIERTISHYKWMVAQGLEYRSFRKAIARNIRRAVNLERPLFGNYKNYFEASLYGEAIERLYQYFPKEAVCFVTTESLQTEPQQVMNTIIDFLKLDSMLLEDKVEANTTKDVGQAHKGFDPLRFIKLVAHDGFVLPLPRTPSVGDESRQWLKKQLQKDLEKQQELIPNLFDQWKL